MTPTVRMPYRVWFYISGTGWNQGQNNAYVLELATVKRPLTAQELEDDAFDRLMIGRIDRARTNADGSLTIPVVDTDELAFWEKEAQHSIDATLYGDNSLDDLADRNAGRAFARRLAALRESGRVPAPVVELAPEPVKPVTILVVKPRPGFRAPCLGCGASMAGKRPHAATCSPRCRQIVSRARRAS